jgi:hypothetical protein
MTYILKKRRTIVILISLIVFAVVMFKNSPSQVETSISTKARTAQPSLDLAKDALDKLAVKGRAPSTGYSREQFGASWSSAGGCDTRNIILNRDLLSPVVDDQCTVVSGILNDPYTGKIINFRRGADTSGDIQIDHVVALSDAWQKGAQQMARDKRVLLVNDPMELLAVDGKSNINKSNGDAATWLPPNKSFRCQYVARQVAVKQKYNLWVTQSEHDAIDLVLDKCPGQMLPSP